MVWIGVYFAERPSKCHSSCGSDSVRDVELHHQIFLSRRKKVTPVFDLGVRGLAPDPKSLSDLQPEPNPNHIAE